MLSTHVRAAVTHPFFPQVVIEHLEEGHAFDEALELAAEALDNSIAIWCRFNGIETDGVPHLTEREGWANAFAEFLRHGWYGAADRAFALRTTASLQ